MNNANILPMIDREKLKGLLRWLEIFPDLEDLQRAFRELGGPPEAVLHGEKVILVIAGSLADWEAWRALKEESRDFLQPHEPTWPGDGLTKEYYFGLLRQWWHGWFQKTDYGFLVFLRGADGKPGELMGGIWLGDIRHEFSHKGSLGFWIGKRFTRRGYMTEAAQLVCDFAFNRLGLHRIEASCAVNNEPCKVLLKRSGFKEIGTAESYMLIDGKWQDQILWSKVYSH